MCKKFEEKIYCHREKEDNWDIIRKAEDLGFKKPDDLRWLGSEIELDVEVGEETTKVLKLNGVDVSDKDIYI